jgi:hypothetical protein
MFGYDNNIEDQIPVENHTVTDVTKHAKPMLENPWALYHPLKHVGLTDEELAKFHDTCFGDC